MWSTEETIVWDYSAKKNHTQHHATKLNHYFLYILNYNSTNRMTNECVKCDKPMPKKNDGWVECSCSAHPGWYCDSHSPGNECFDDEECDCCNPLEDKKEYGYCCECDFPKFIINDGIQSCSRCGKDDHYKCGVVADHSEDEEEESEVE